MNQRRGLDVDQSIISLHETGSLYLGIVEFAKQYCDLDYVDVMWVLGLCEA